MLAGLDGPGPESVMVKAVYGFPVEELINAGEDADMIVLGSRGAGGQVAQDALCPVLIVPPENRG